jgi:hypothetical protein
MVLPLSGRVLVIGIGVLLLVASPFVYRWGKRHSRIEGTAQQIRIQMFPGWVVYIIVGILFIVAGVLA